MKRRVIGLVAAPAMVAALIAVSPPASAVATFQNGDVLAGPSTGTVLWLAPDGTSKGTLNAGTASYMTGGTFDSAGNFYSTTFNARKVAKFDSSGTFLGFFGPSDFGGSVESMLFNSVGDVFVSRVDTGALYKLDATGVVLNTWTPATEDRGVDWIDLMADQCTLRYTSEGSSVKQFNVCTGTQMADFATGLPGLAAYAIRNLPDGGALVADTDRVVRLDASGAIVQSYLTGDSDLFALNLDPDGTSFWTANFTTGDIHRVNIATGAVLGVISPGVGVYGLTIKGELTQANQPPAVTADHATVEVNEGSAAANTGTYSDPEGKAVTLTASVGSVVDNGDGTWSWSYTPADGPSDSQTVTITVTDVGGQAATATFALSVLNVAPTVTITSPAAGTLYSLGSTVPLEVSFSDPGTADTHTCSVAWDGSGTSSAPVVTEASGSGTCTESMVYSGTGVYTITATITDKDGATGTASVMVVVYDPSAGFVTGGGWITSPEGAYVPQPSLTGKAIFGFVSKYQKGATVPTGQTEFQFGLAGFNFHSDAYQWLVVAGAKAQYKGTGSVNGESGYGFLLTATDGQLSGGGGTDKFRIKIWNVTSGTVVYDNVLGAGDDLDNAAPQAIGGGSIVIHK